MSILEPNARPCSACGQRPERYDGTYYEPALCYPCWQARQGEPCPPEQPGNLRCPQCGNPWIDCPHNPPFDDRIEMSERASAVTNILERCSEELARLELIPTQDADDVNALSAARGFVSRARNALRGRFQ